MNYKKVIFTNSDIQGKDFNDNTFESCKFIKIVFRFTNFENCKFENCDFSESIFESIGFSNCDFFGTKLSFLDFGSASIFNCKFNNSVAENCIFHKLKGGSKTERKIFDLRNCEFKDMELKGSVFVFCNISNVNFNGSDLESVVFERCDLEKTNFTNAKIDGAGFNECKIKETYLDINGFIDFGTSKGFKLQN